MCTQVIDLSTYCCWLVYFDGAKRKILNPGREHIEQALAGLQKSLEINLGVVELYRAPNEDSMEQVYCMQFRGKPDCLMIAVDRDGVELFYPNFDTVLRERSTFEILGDEWESSHISTSRPISNMVAMTFAQDGRLALADIWTVFESRP